MVGYNQTFYTTTEGNVSVTICVVIFEPQTGGSSRSFTLSYNTENYTAGNGNILNSREYSRDGIRIRWNVMNTRVSIAVPNCADNQLVMWVFCSHGQVEDPVTWVYYNITFMRFVVMRGLNLNELSHGIIGN